MSPTRGSAGQIRGVEIQYRDYAAGGAWQSVVKWYTDATMDQIGYTERIALPYAMRPQVRVRRRGQEHQHAGAR